MHSYKAHVWNSNNVLAKKKRKELLINGVLNYECLKCHRLKQYEDYYQNSTHVIQSYCKECMRSQHRQKYKGLTPAQILKLIKSGK